MPELTAIKVWKKKWGYYVTDDYSPEAPERSPLPPLPGATPTGVRYDDSEEVYRKNRTENDSTEKSVTLNDSKAKSENKIKPSDIEESVNKFDAYLKARSEKKDDVTAESTLVGDLGEPDEPDSEAETDEEIQFEEYDALGQPLAQSIMDRLGDRWAVDRTAAEDQITGKIYTKKRQEALTAAAPGHYLVREYGMRTIKDMSPVEQRGGMRVDNPLSAIYLRDAPDTEVQKLFGELYEKRKTPAKFVDGQMFIVNSDKVIGKLDAVYGSKWTDPSPPKQPSKTYQPDIKPLYDKIEKLDNGFHVITMKRKLTDEERGIFEGKMLYGVGATPSSYQAVKLIAAPANPTLTDPALLSATSLDNKGKLDRALTSKAATTMTALPLDHPMKTTAAAAFKMVEGLKKALAEKVLKANGDAFDKNKLVGAALDNINQLMEAMPTYMDDIPRFARLFDVLVDEVHLVLATCKPYGKDEFRTASAKMITDRAPALATIPEVQNETYMLSSGMDTMSTAVAAAMAMTGANVDLLDQNASGGGRSANYFEVQMHLLGKGALAGTGPLIMGSLNPSTPTVAIDSPTAEGWTVKKLIEEIDKRVKGLVTAPSEAAPAVVIIDVTVEKETETAADQEINQIIVKFKDLIDAKKMQIMLCKSYQKFPSLGSGKAMSGGLTVIGKGAKCEALKKTVGEAETSEGFLDNDETQLVTHFMTHEAEMERPMLKRAAKNAKFLRGLMPATIANKDTFSYDEGLPFLVANGERIAFDLPGDPPYQAKKKTVPAQYLAYPMGVERRFSFGFQNSSCLPIGSAGSNKMVRIGAGQESEGELVEKFYALTRLTAATPPSVKDVDPTPVTADTIGGYARDAAGKALDDVTTVLTRYSAETEEKKKDDGRRSAIDTLITAGLIDGADVQRDKTGKITKIQNRSAVKAVEEAIKADKIKAHFVERVDGAPVKLNTPASVGAIRTMIKEGLISDADVTFGSGFVTLKGANTPEAIDKKIKQTLDDLKAAKGLTPEQALKAKLALLSSATTAQLSDEDRKLDNVNLMHASVGRGWRDNRSGEDKEKSPLPKQGVEAAYLPNIVASCALTTASIFTRPTDAKAFTDLADPLIAHGIDQVSPEMREKLLTARVNTIFKGGVAAIPGGTKKIAECVDKMPYREGGANLLKGPDLAQAMLKGALTETDRDALAEACTGRLDIQSKLNLLNGLTQSAKEARAKAGDARVEAGTARVKATRLQSEAETKRLAVPGSRKHKRFKDLNNAAGIAEKAARDAEAEALKLERIRDDLEQRQAAHPLLAKSCAKLLKAEIGRAAKAFDDTIAKDERPEPPLSPAKIGDIPLGEGKGAPTPILKTEFEDIRKKAKAAIEEAETL